jgi:Replication-relaxation
VLAALAKLDVSTTRQVARAYWGTREPTESQEREMRRIVAWWRAQGIARTIDTWIVPVHGLTAKGAKKCGEEGLGDPKELDPEHSTETLRHELERADFHLAVESLCGSRGWTLYWRKTDLSRSVDPDDLFAIEKGTGTSYLFYEKERRRKTLDDLYVKARRYYDLYGTDKCLTEWGDFTTFRVIFEMRSEESAANLLAHLAGECRCRHYRGKLKHTCLSGTGKKPLKVANIWVTWKSATDDVAGRIFLTPADRGAKAYSFDDL